jgi:alcohol dehydrogenase (cytochrome c)
VYYGTGNPGADFYGADRNGDNLYTDCLLALDPKTGKLKWYRQELPHDVWDYDSSFEALLFKRAGKDLLVHLSKNGFVFVMDRRDGRLDNVWPLYEGYNFTKSIDRRRPGGGGDRRDPRSGQGCRRDDRGVISAFAGGRGRRCRDRARPAAALRRRRQQHLF